MGYAAVTVQSTGATLILAANNARKSMIIYNNGSVIIYVGPDSSITTSNAIPLLPQSSMGTSGLFENWKGAVYGLAASSTADVRYWEWNP